MNENKRKLDTKTGTTIIFSIIVCLLVVGMYVITNKTGRSYALTIDDIDAKDVEKISVKTGYFSDYTIPTAYKPSDAEENWVPLRSKFKGDAIVGSSSAGQQTYRIDMFCLEMSKDIPVVPDGADPLFYNPVNNSSSYIDEGITYIINTAYKGATSTDSTISLSDDAYYNAQIALWMYQYKTSQVAGMNDTDKTKLNNMWSSIEANKTEGNAKIIYDYVVNAMNVKANTTDNSIVVSKGKNELTLSEDKTYYETDLLTVSITTAANTTFSGFNFTFNSNNYETTIVDESGNTITDYTQLQDKKFRIRIPAASLEAGSKTNITGEFYGVFTHKSFLAFAANTTTGDYQIALLATSTNNTKTQKIELNVEIPDTGVNYSQYIYIIGAMVLVIGISIIYVNTRSKEN